MHQALRTLPRIQRPAGYAAALCQRRHLSAQHSRGRRSSASQARQPARRARSHRLRRNRPRLLPRGRSPTTCSAKDSSASSKSPPRASAPSSSIAGRKTARPTPGTICSEVLDEHWRHDRPRRRNALFRRRLGAGAALARSGLSHFLRRQPNLSQGPAPARCGRRVSRSTAILVETDAPWLAPRPIAASAMSRPSSTQHRRNSGRTFTASLPTKSPPQPPKTLPACSASAYDVGN